MTKIELSLHRAIESGDDKVAVKILAENPELINRVFINDSWLHVAVESNRPVVVQKLVSMGCDVDSTQSLFEGTALDLAVANGQNECAQILLKSGASVSRGSLQSDSLWTAVVDNRLDLVKLLLKYGADPSTAYTFGWSVRNAVNRAAELDHQEILNFFIDHGYSAIPNTVAFSFIESHLAPFFGERKSIDSVMEGYANPRIGVLTNSQALTLFTDGLSSVELNLGKKGKGHKFVELVMHLPNTWDLEEDSWPVDWLSELAVNAAEEKSWFPGPCTIVSNENPPEPLSSDSEMSCWLIMEVPAKWGFVTTEQNKTIQFFTVCPIFAEERDFEKQFGLVKLLERFQQHKVSTMVVKSRVNVALA